MVGAKPPARTTVLGVPFQRNNYLPPALLAKERGEEAVSYMFADLSEGVRS